MLLFTGGCADNSTTLSAGSARMMDVWHRQSAPTIQSCLFFIPRTAGRLNGSLSTSSPPLPHHPHTPAPSPASFVLLWLPPPHRHLRHSPLGTLARFGGLEPGSRWRRLPASASAVPADACVKFVSRFVFLEFYGATGVLFCLHAQTIGLLEIGDRPVECSVMK